jgi:heme oxygenase
VEHSLPLMQKDLDTATYVSCLCRLHGINAAWEEHARTVAPQWLCELLAVRERTSFLERDITWFSKEIPPSRASLAFIKDLPSVLGAMYVMEGSSLGGQLIARHVQIALGLTQGRGNAFFHGYGSESGPLWKEFCEMLKTRIPEDQTDKVVLGAKAMFTTFGSWMQEKSVVYDL